MGMSSPDATMDTYLAKIATATRLTVCSAEPANYAGIAAVALADVALTAGNGNGDFVIANGDVSGRKLSLTQQANIPIDASGNGNHLVYDDGSAIVFIGTNTSQALTSGGTVTVPAYDIVELRDPAAA